jgi:flagellar protein FliO/FliZ
MSQQVIYVAVFMVAIACLPWLTKWLVGRNSLGKGTTSAGAKIISVVAVGPTQRIVTLEAGPEHDRLCLVLGVTSQQITCLHRSPASVALLDQLAQSQAPNLNDSGTSHA